MKEIQSHTKDSGTSVKERDNIDNLKRIQEEISGLDVNLRSVPGRYLIKRGVMTKLCRRKSKKYTFFLFNDILIYCSQSLFNSRLIHRKTILPTEVSSLPDGTVIGYDNAFTIESAKKSFTVVVDSLSLKEQWLSALEDVVSSNYCFLYMFLT